VGVRDNFSLQSFAEVGDLLIAFDDLPLSFLKLHLTVIYELFELVDMIGQPLMLFL
jgi:hypothetical protein